MYSLSWKLWFEAFLEDLELQGWVQRPGKSLLYILIKCIWMAKEEGTLAYLTNTKVTAN